MTTSGLDGSVAQNGTSRPAPTPAATPHAPAAAWRYWPFGSPRAAFVVAPVLLVALLFAWWVAGLVLRVDEVDAGWVLLGIAVLSVLPILLIFVLLQRWVVQAVVMSGLKG